VRKPYALWKPISQGVINERIIITIALNALKMGIDTQTYED